MAEQHSRLMLTLVRCMRLAFTGAAPVADGDISYATLPGTGRCVCPVQLQNSSSGVSLYIIYCPLRVLSMSILYCLRARTIELEVN